MDISRKVLISLQFKFKNREKNYIEYKKIRKLSIKILKKFDIFFKNNF